MDWLNYHHLFYFWTVAREGGVSRAAVKLRLAQPTISAQIRRLEEAVGEPLLQRQGRTVVLTDTGRMVFGYADEIFGLGRELMETLRGRPAGRPPHLTVGIANVVPKLIVARLLRAAGTRGAMHLVCREDNAEQLLAQVATHAIDVAIADTPAPPHVRVKVFNHLLGESDTAFFAPRALAARLRRRFPASLADAPLLLPTAHTAMRRALDEWFDREQLRVRAVGEFDDSALMKAFAQGSAVVFPAPAAIAADVARLYQVRLVGRTAAVRERYYAISAQRRVTHPGVLAITGAGRDVLFR